MLKKGLFFANILLLVLIFIGGCSNSSSTNGSYAAILMANGKEYYWQGIIKDNEFTLGEKIGEVQKIIAKEDVPKENFLSNFLGLNVGEEIHSSNEDSKVIIVKKENGDYLKFTEKGYYKDKD
ncbi:hypothetical protein AWH56_011600 [Anaerobacillus isosaccharinicus]|uniref:Lipoprotein n=1 Tax=Anaerobacillus isosaccharinicus TaxID=1532552 RepID=A0A1S2LV46_9BACI|nr:hypothetical protein [Anaerobacillus isosaccharinicus]MBA5588456.1 hypothetical protein [Anaerobacillus isosaccharinicus]QOY38118.1 hypothetical protein AWH56_011600 [Anaerobacillus isosaccharinicus]